MITVFFSYSHKDESLRNELETHLSMLKRQGLISTWHDRRLGAGKEIDTEVSKNLEAADVILLLVSPYFLDSDYCYDREMHRALERHDDGSARVIPVILHPCDWHNAPFGKLRACPTDGKPISKFPNQHDAFLEVTKDIRLAAEELGRGQSVDRVERETKGPPIHQASGNARTSNLRVKREFTDREQDAFLDETYEFIARFFEASLKELESRNIGLETRFKRIDQNHFTASIYVGGEKRSSCQIWHAGRDSFPAGIGFAYGESGRGGSFNESLSVADDGYNLLLKPLGLAFQGGAHDDYLTQQGGAEYLWSVLIRPLQ